MVKNLIFCDICEKQINSVGETSESRNYILLKNNTQMKSILFEHICVECSGKYHDGILKLVDEIKSSNNILKS